MSTRIVSMVILLAVLLAGCAPSGGADDAAVATLVAAALQTSQAANPPALETAGPQLGYVEGSTCYPSSFIPEMTVYLHNAGSNAITEVPIAMNQMSFSAELEAGSYTAYAWLPDFSFGGSYSQAVACGLSAECTDHSLVNFDVVAGELTGGIAVCDWYGQPGDVPYPPGVQPPADSSSSDTVDSGQSSGGSGSGLGSISGTLSFPSEMIPSMTVVAWSLQNPGQYYYVITGGGAFYQISNLPVGGYQVVAYAAGLAGGYTPAVPCGLSVDCTDHGLATVQVTADQVTGGVDPQDWYAPDGSFPSNPVP